ncbi:MAG: phage tail tape measure protein [Methanobrevibacter sp.]|nr:phage tail tape measure protein [Methanobrevibacter sp.]
MADSAVKTAYIKLKYNGKDAEAGIRRVTDAFSTFRKVVTTVVAGKMVRDVTRFGREITNLSDRTGMSVQKLSSLRNVFISAGAGARGFSRAIGEINHGLMALQRGETEWATKLYPLGISPWGKNPKEIMLETADAVKRMIDTGAISEEQAIDYLISEFPYNEKQARLMLGGSQAFLENEAKLREKVGEAQQRNIDNLDKLKTSLDDLSASWENAKTNVIGFFGEPLMKGVDALTSVLKYFGDNEVIGGINGLAAILIGMKGTSMGVSMAKGALAGSGGATAVAAGGGFMAGVGGLARFGIILAELELAAHAFQGAVDIYKSSGKVLEEWTKELAESGEWYLHPIKTIGVAFGQIGEWFGDLFSEEDFFKRYKKDGKWNIDALLAHQSFYRNISRGRSLTQEELMNLKVIEAALQQASMGEGFTPNAFEGGNVTITTTINGVDTNNTGEVAQVINTTIAKPLGQSVAAIPPAQ